MPTWRCKIGKNKHLERELMISECFFPKVLLFKNPFLKDLELRSTDKLK